jgi:succinate dehydrogenase/fumarate reductase cytochrome b subunit
VEYIFVIHQVTGVKLMAKSFTWTVVLLAASMILKKNINFNDVVAEFAHVKATNLHCKFEIVHGKC